MFSWVLTPSPSISIDSLFILAQEKIIGLKSFSSFYTIVRSEVQIYYLFESILVDFPSSFIHSLSPVILWRRKWQLTPVFLRGEFHGWMSLLGCSPWGHRVRHDWVTNTHIVILWFSYVALVVRNLPANTGDMIRGFYPWVRKIWRKAWQPTAVF